MFELPEGSLPGGAMAAASARRPRTTRAPRVVVFILTVLAVGWTPRPADGVWELEQLYEDEILEYVQQFTGDLDSAGTAVESKFLRFEQNGWYQILYDQTSAGMDKVRALPRASEALSARAPPHPPPTKTHTLNASPVPVIRVSRRAKTSSTQVSGTTMSSPVSARKRRSCTVTPCVDAVPTSSAPRSASWAAQTTYPWVPPTAKWAPPAPDRNSGPTAAAP